MYDFKFKPFEEMTPEDYAKVGFKSGLEVHQQLLTEKKLFCRCPAGHYNNHEYNAEILRHMRPTLSELGEYDGTALMEFKTKKEILYRINYDTVCTYEMDDTPPFQINDQALDIAIEVGMLYDATIVNELHIARKQYLDGSIPTGFQRTAITCVGGSIPFKDKRINLIQMSIEEDSCREFSDQGHTRIYLTDRLGMPLIETVTEPEMKTPQEVAEVNEAIRRIARSTGHVRTGIGAGRQDVNVSVTGGTRIEIKGVHKIKNIPRLTYNEAMRQWNLLRLREELANRGITEDTFEANFKDVTKTLRKTRFQIIKDAIDADKVVKCVRLKGFKGLLTWQTQTDTVFSKELSDRVRVIACLSELPNIIHSDSPSEKLSSYEWSSLKKSVGATDKDTIVLVWGSEEDTETGANEIIIRAKEATIGIPSETRQALIDGTTGFERILPGPERMYPDTDLPPKTISAERLQRIKDSLTEPYWEREAKYKKLGVPEDSIKSLAISPFAATFDKVVEMGVDPKLAAVALTQFVKRLRKSGQDTEYMTEVHFLKIFELFKAGKLAKDGIYDAMKRTIVLGEISEDNIPEICSESEMKGRINETREFINKMRVKYPDKKGKVFMGAIMKKLRGRVNGADILKLVNEFSPEEV